VVAAMKISIFALRFTDTASTLVSYQA